MITFFHTISRCQLWTPSNAVDSAFFATVKVITINIINRQKNKTKQIIFATSAYKMKSD